ncbi:winged helix-turn-helix domain-containing protein [Elioraea rosea]|uniref:winged helix-turn-helix domain-containing protein n=1 Tax=Elioraea rosea TaxID=2492390 RepID=UPI001183FC4B|nr:winged helix-turn-helix domain-containing protein [Elioraea rosea]
MRYRVGPYAIDTAAYELRRDGILVPIEPQVFELLALLIAARARVVDKDEIIRTVWQGRPVSDATLSSRIKAARRVLGDSGRDQGMIRTVYRRGFRFVASVSEHPDPRAKDRRPKLAVRSFATHGLGADRRLAAGITEEVIDALAGSGEVMLIAAHAVPGRGFAPTHAVEGRLRCEGPALRLSARLLDARSGAALWCGRIDGVRGSGFVAEERIGSALAEAVLAALRGG